MKESAYKSYEDLPLFLNAELVAQVLGISQAGAYDLLHSEGFPVLKIGTRMVGLACPARSVLNVRHRRPEPKRKIPPVGERTNRTAKNCTAKQRIGPFKEDECGIIRSIINNGCRAEEPEKLPFGNEKISLLQFLYPYRSSFFIEKKA